MIGGGRRSPFAHPARYVFCSEIRELKDVLFAKMFHKKKAACHPKIVFATATMTREYVGLLSSLTTIGLPPQSIQWDSNEDSA